MMIKILLLLSVIIYQTTPTEFIVKGTIRCNLHKTFNATMTLIEYDDLTLPDVIKKETLIDKASRVTHNYTIRETYSEGDGILDYTYEIGIYVSHDCLTNRSDKSTFGYINKVLGDVPIKTAVASFNHDFVLDDKVFIP